MEAKTKKRLIVIGVIVAVIALLIILAFVLPGSKDTVATIGVSDPFVEETYQNYLDDNGFDGTYAAGTVEVGMENFTAEGMEAKVDAEGVTLGDRGNITWSFDVPEAGFYNLKFKYYSVDGTNATPERSLQIDGKTLFDGMKQLSFPRSWLNNEGEIEQKNGSDVRPKAKEIFEENGKEFFYSDQNYRSLEPYAFYLSEGAHTITVLEAKESVKISGITFCKAEDTITYEEYKKQHEGAPVYSGEALVGQAERSGDFKYDGKEVKNAVTKIVKSSPSIGMSSDYSSSYTVPYHHWNVLLNTLGGTSWQTPGDKVEWTVQVPEEGFYELSFRGRQSTNRGVKSFRRLMVNGKVPFEEAKKVGFDFSGAFQNYVVSDGEGKPILIYLNKGENTIAMDVCLGDFAEAYTEINKSVQSLNNLYLRISQITGTVPDKHIDYEIAEKIDGFEKIMRQQTKTLNHIVDLMVEITGEKGSSTTNLEKVANQCERFAKDPDKVVVEISSFKSNISALSTWMLSISEMPLEIDSLTLSAPGAELKPAEPNGLKAAYHEAIRFFATFFVDETQISDEEGESKDALKVWVQTGRDQANVIKNQIENSQLETKVNLQLIPASVILPATLAGNGPDVVLNMPQATVIDFAIRGAITDLSKMNGFQDQAKRFYPSALETVTYNGGVYGLPETENFNMMFYRNDILEELGIEVPKTWEEVGEVISVLHINNYDFYMPSTPMLSTLVYQNGGDMYLGREDIKETYGLDSFADGQADTDYGIESGLREEEAMIAFKKLCEFFTAYKLPVSVDFSNRFRTGEIPIGIADYTIYNTLEVFAPEIKGLWSFAPIPGFQKEDGSINNTAVASSVHSVILSSSKRQEEGWEFINWWLDDDTQTEYAQTIEAIMGSGARYATANKNVLRQLPWSATQADTLLKQFGNTKGIPDVPGYYMTTRMITYAYDNVVTDGQNPREALYLNVKEINEELTKKRKEFHLSYIEDEEYHEEGSDEK